MIASGGPETETPSEDDFIAHWRALAGNERIPTLAAFLDNPEPRFAPWIYILDVVSDDCLPVRLFGTRMTESFGEITGLNFLDFLSRDVRGPIGRAHRLICERPCGWVTYTRAVTTAGRAVIPETITLPLLRKGVANAVVKLTKIVHTLEFRESLVSVDKIESQYWIDLGAGLPSPQK
jgi:hypothetical protein